MFKERAVIIPQHNTHEGFIPLDNLIKTIDFDKQHAVIVRKRSLSHHTEQYLQAD